MLELSRIQSNILRGFRRGSDPAVERYTFLHFREEAGARAFIKALLPRVTSCKAYDDGATAVLNIGLTYAAVDMFGYGGEARSLDARDDEATATVEAFIEGMRCRAESILGDVGPSAPEHWQEPYREQGAEARIHAVLCINARPGYEDALAQLQAEIDVALADHAGAVKRLHDELGRSFTGEYEGTEQFGYADGIAQPAILEAGGPSYPGDGTARKRRGWDPLEPGEFVLGHIDETGQIQFRSHFFRNGSFMVFRKLRQHVGKFREYTQQVAKRRGVTVDYVGAKMVGRWKSGAPLVLAPHEDDPELAADPERNNDFRYADDEHGLRCPLGAHIRRNNPREDPTGPGTVQTRQHRIIRRSIPYGPRLPEGQPDDGVDRGVLFVVINGDIARQFEFVQLNWVNSVLSSDGLTLPQDRDPIIGQQVPPTDGQPAGKFVIPSSERTLAPVIAWSLPTFVTTRGGAYFLLPSLDALWNVANGPDCGGQQTMAHGEGCNASPQPSEDASVLPESGGAGAGAGGDPGAGAGAGGDASAGAGGDAGAGADDAGDGAGAGDDAGSGDDAGAGDTPSRTPQTHDDGDGGL